jgi:hypothetical protein
MLIYFYILKAPYFPKDRYYLISISLSLKDRVKLF